MNGLPVNQIITGDCLEVMRGWPHGCVDAVVTDPPYGLTANKRGGSGAASLNLESPAGRARIGTGNGGGFMGMAWDSGVPPVEVWAEALRVLKPGAHLLAFGGTRTYHRMACAIEDAGFEIRDQMQWLYGSGFPKSLDVGKAIDKAAGAEREVMGVNPNWRPAQRQGGRGFDAALGGDALDRTTQTAPATPAAQQWDGWGTALKPAHECICVARKPFVGTVADNVLAHGTGALNIDGCRIEGEPWKAHDATGLAERKYFTDGNARVIHKEPHTAGRWPANVILDEEAGAMLDAQSGENPGSHDQEPTSSANSWFGRGRNNGTGHNDSGGASRFFYCAKASRAERNAGLGGGAKKFAPKGNHVTRDMANPKNHLGGLQSTYARNHHPTVKPVDLMAYLCRLVTPPGGIVLDPFCGSGTTCVAAKREGFNYIGIDISEEYCEIARRRVAHTERNLFAGAKKESVESVESVDEAVVVEKQSKGKRGAK